MNLINPIELPSEDLLPQPSIFNHPSDLHGQLHVGRVMIHAFNLLELTGNVGLATQLWAAVYIHDLERNHDGVCFAHGERAAVRLGEDDALAQHLSRGGLEDEHYPSVQRAATQHSLFDELPRDDPDWTLTALLKDADGLDRVRLGDLDPSFLRFDVSASLIPFAQSLYDRSDRVLKTGRTLFPDLWIVAQSI